MAPLGSLVSLVLLVASAVPSVVAGPYCAKKHHGKPWCVQLCKSHWGWKSHMMGTDRWGGVMQKVDSKDWDSFITKACGLDVSHHQNATSPVGNGEVGVSSMLPSAVPSSSIAPLISHPISSSVVVSTSKPLSSAKPTTIKSTTTIKPTTTLSSFTRSTIHSTTHPITTVKPTTTPKPTTTAKPAPTTTATSGGSTGNSDQGQYLSDHNSFRAQHGAAALTWSDELAAKAQQWANGCQFKHSGGSLGPYGENLAAGTGSSYDIASAIKSWTDESKDYNPVNPTFSHFTQVVWKSTKQLGCAIQSCDGIFDASYGNAKYYVCEYFPAGNVIGQFDANVQA